MDAISKEDLIAEIKKLRLENKILKEKLKLIKEFYEDES